MSPITRLSLRLRIFLFFALLGLGGIVLLAVGMAFGYRQLSDPEALSAFVLAGVLGGFAILALTTWIWVLFDEHVARPVERLAAEMRARVHAGVGAQIDSELATYLGDLAPAASAVAERLAKTRTELDTAVAEKTARLRQDTARVTALLAEMPDGVVFCSSDHRVVLYNARAVDTLGEGGHLGLDRPISEAFLTGPLTQAYERLCQSPDAGRADVLTATQTDARLMELRMRLVPADGAGAAAPGYLLSVHDLSDDLSHDADADWPKETIAAVDIATSISARLARHNLALRHDLGETLLRCDGFAIARLFEHLARSWAKVAGHGAFVLTFERRPEGAQLSLRADTGVPNYELVDDWLDQPLSAQRPQFTGRAILVSHGVGLQLDDGLGLILEIAGRAVEASGGLEYDFGLLDRRLSDADLRALSFVVFDTETTGLDPQRDEVCQIAACRVVNGRTVEAECFDSLANPGRSIPSSATAVHKISNEMVADAPPVGTVVQAFHGFAGGAVLVAHNAPFDMAFLKRRETEIGNTFDQPILDTVLLSAILFGASADHTLDTLCDRLEIVIPPADRHTALGDAKATAHAFCRMLTMLEAAGFSTLEQLIAEFGRHRRVIKSLN
ncbi:MAG: exonuclease domain-containing protein [Pseudomonadota bacterium]